MYCYFWSKEPGKPAQAGGFLRIDGFLREAIEFGLQCKHLGLVHTWRFT